MDGEGIILCGYLPSFFRITSPSDPGTGYIGTCFLSG